MLWYLMPAISPAISKRFSRGCAKNFGEGVMPRVVNMITGPSRSADIEQTLILGAHGPRRLHVVVVEK